jgi:hypothetical protein
MAMNVYDPKYFPIEKRTLTKNEDKVMVIHHFGSSYLLMSYPEERKYNQEEIQKLLYREISKYLNIEIKMYDKSKDKTALRDALLAKAMEVYLSD